MRTAIIVVCLILAASLIAKPTIPISRVSSPIVIDGVLDDAAWQDIAPLPPPIEYVPNEGEPPTQRTEVRIAYDNDWFYIVFEAWCDPEQLKVTVAPRSGWSSDDQVVFCIDVYNTDRECCLFNFNALGNPKDWLNSTSGASDMNWDIPLRSTGRIYSDRYIVEAAIPFRSLSFDDSLPEQRWGFYYFRKDEQHNEHCVYPPRSQSINNLLSQNGVLDGMRDVKAGNRIELVPYGFGSYIHADSTWDGDVGVDVETALTSQLQLSATLNPDYSQIEADAFDIEVNSRDLQWLEEKRPFFTRGLDFFHTGMINLLYTRNIVNPVAGMKLSGKYTDSSFGLLSALDEGVDGDRNDLYNIFRWRHNVLSESTAGLILTSRDDLDSDTWNRVAAGDFMLRLPPNTVCKLQIVGSADHSSLDDDTSKGWAGNATFNYNSDALDVNSWVSAFSENFEPGAGFLNSRDRNTLRMGSFANHDIWKDVGPWEEISVFAGTGGVTSIDLVSGDRNHWFGIEADWNNRMWTQLEGKINHNEHTWIENGIEQERMFNSFEIEFHSWKYWSGAFDGWFNADVGHEPWYGDNDNDEDPGFEGWYASCNYGCNVRPLDRLSLDMNMSIYDLRTRWQGDRKHAYVTLWSKVSVMLTRGLFLRNIVQAQREWMEYPRDSSKASCVNTIASCNVLLTWEYQPLSTVYVGCNLLDFDRWDNMGDNVQAFAKMNYLWSL
ncbi:MAG: carbohydrate binding family 9 domain-containing protein [Candidatus Cloacimonetes bacterium]|nr:carbohydrate binding family 9 domain-containing protein [Candidatus Cloacimonadota bacterium]